LLKPDDSRAEITSMSSATHRPTRAQASAPTAHVVSEPEWVIGRETGFRATCQCGWVSPLVDTASLVRSVVFNHTVSGQPPSEAGRRSRWRRRG
jgi:hypothetical protein